MIKVTVWNEYLHEVQSEEVASIYPKGIHGCIADFLGEEKDIQVVTATLNQPEHGLADDVLDNTDVLIWWGHQAHHLVRDEVAYKVQQKVLKGMGLIVLHSGHMAKPFTLLMGTSCALKWRDGDYERLWTVMPGHPIAQGVPEMVEIECEEMYGEHFDIPQPDELVFIGWFDGGEAFRSGCCWNRGYGKVFYFQPGHEYNPTYHHKDIQKVIKNSVYWANPTKTVNSIECPNIVPSLESVRKEKK